MNKKSYKEYRKHDIKTFSEIYKVEKKEIRKIVKDLKKFCKKKRTIGKVLAFIEGHGINKSTAYKMSGMLQSWSENIVDTVDNRFHCEENDPELFAKIKDRNWKLRLGEGELKGREARRAHRDGSGVYSYKSDQCLWKDLSELPDHNNSRNICGEILVTGVWDQYGRHETVLVGFFAGWNCPKVEIIRLSTFEPWDHADKIEKWMEVPEYKQWERN